MFQSDSEYVDEYLYPFDSVDVNMLLKEHSLDLGSGWSISEEEYKKVVERNFQEHISEFFEKGLYAVETSIERTTTSLEEGSQHQILSVQQQRERLSELLNKIGFGMNTSKENALLGALANRDELAIVESDFEVDNDVEKLKSRMSKISELVAKVDNREAVANINRMIETIYEKTRNPLEIEYYKMQTLDFSQLSKDEISKHIENFVLRGSSTLKEFIEKSDYRNYDKMFEMYRNGLERLSKGALIQLKDDYRANNASAMVNGKLADINRVVSLLEQVAPLDKLEIFGELSENDREKYNALLREVVEAKRKVCENSIVNLEHDAFLGEEIGKTTVSVATEKKDEAGIRIQRDKQEILQMSEHKMQE